MTEHMVLHPSRNRLNPFANRAIMPGIPAWLPNHFYKGN
jgi:hypothetical protein